MVLAVAPVLLAGPAAAKPDPGNGDPIRPSYIPGSFPDEVVEVHDLTNQERRRDGCHNDLRVDEALANAADDHSKHMSATANVTHEGEGGSGPDDRMEAAGYDTSKGWGENIAQGYDTPEAVMAGWMKSKPHRKNILNCDFKALGVGIARAVDGTLYWTQDFGGT
ncbi:hypothetical protein GCM10009681_34060 [Luedemannella helvata]|uniref:SCP domain-containing protein n=1 Tax=Luedemannella helvata TaxID=349315 RepID=A0ABP4WQ35_9ACTN